jgi:signal transduction histidine kinase
LTKDKIIIGVKDQGIGIREEDKEKLFKPFEMHSYGEHLNPSGTGIGLSICHKMLTTVGGSIELEHTSIVDPHKGSTFVFTVDNKLF